MTEPFEPPPGYLDDCRRLLAAAYSFLREAKEPVVFHLPPWFTDEKIMPVGALSLLERWAADDHTRAFVAHLERETNHKCTMMQFRSVVLPMFLRANQGGEA